MREQAVIGESGVREFLGRIVERTRAMAPTRRGKTAFDFQWVDDPGEIELTYPRTVLPPKKALLPPRETLLEFRAGPEPTSSPVVEDEPFTLLGVHPCDLKAVAQLDWAMGRRHEVADPHYLARRRAATIVGVDCLPDEYCFCTSVGSNDTREGADVFLTPIGGGYLMEVLTAKGEALIEGGTGLRQPTRAELAAAESFREEKARRMTARIEADWRDLPHLLEAHYDSEIWERTAERCYSCGTCTDVCPTCFCFDVNDSVNLPLVTGTRRRRYDSCQFLDFALVAGPHNFRPDRVDRVRHRWFRKFVYLLREHGMPFCVGCGRCSQACTAGISLTDVINAVIAEAKKGAPL